jgi:beta-lactam-binding protein with PASTA domain
MNKFFLYLRTATFRKNLLIAIGSILAFVLIIIFILNFYTRHGQSLPVPQLRGLPVEKAIALLESQGLGYQIDSVYQIDKPPGTVIEQDPDPNTNVKANRTIYLTIITSQAPNVEFPDIIEKTFLEVKAVLNSFGLKVGDTVYRSDIARDRVLEARFGGQSLRKGEQIPKGSKIDLLLGDGNGSSQVDIPDLTGLKLNDAISRLNAASLKLGNVSFEGVVRDTANAYIIRQIPSLSDSLTTVNVGSRIDVILSNQR